MGGKDSLGLTGGARGEEQRARIAGRDLRGASCDQLRRQVFAARTEGAPALNRAEAFVAADHGDMAQERKFCDLSSPGAEVAIFGSSWTRISAKSFLSTLRSKISTEMPDCWSRISSSDGVEKVLSVAATPPASAVPNTPAKNSSRFVVITPTRVPFATPQATSARATSIECRQRSS